jgi:hypothetical protein
VSDDALVESCDMGLQEAARVINVLRERNVTRVEEVVLLEWGDATAARGSTQPQPKAGVALLEDLGLLTRDGPALVLDDAVVSDGASPAERIDQLPQDAGGIVFQRMMGMPRLRAEIGRVLGYCLVEEGRVLVDWNAVPARARHNPAWLWLQRVGPTAQTSRGLSLDVRLVPFVTEIRHPSIPLSQAALDARLAAQRRRADLAEELVVRLERERLTRHGADYLADAVERVSVADVCAGYDVQSFDVSGGPRLIEVKSCAGPRDRFFLSENERRIAEANGDSYWLAWIGWAGSLPDGTVEIIWVRNLADALRRDPSPWKVSSCDSVIEVTDDDSTLTAEP